jgi:Contractile injection system tape measure protein
MSTIQKHIVNQLSVELKTSSEDEAFGCRKVLEEMLQHEVSNLIDLFCSQYFDENRLIKIDRLEIDLGEITGHNFKEDWLQNFSQSFENQLFKVYQEQNLSPKGTEQNLNNFELLTHFLSTGQLPWWVVQEDIILDDLIDEIIQKQPFELRNFLIQHKNNTLLIQRILFQFSENQISNFLENIQIYIKDFEQSFEEINYQIKRHFSTLALSESQDEIYLETVFKASLKKDFKTFDKQIFISEFLIVLAEKQVIDWSETKVLMLGLLPDFEVNSDFIKEKESVIFEEETQKIKLQNAGIVLISPFLKPFFQELQLLDNDRFINKKAQHKAIHLIKHLATGNTAFSEYDLSLEKLICGIPLNEPVPRKMEFSEKELYEANDLLESVIGHWKVLKNSSVEALRNTFFQREGILQSNQNGWQINIERKTQDILLDSLPWGFSMMVNSWNNYMITIEW